MLRRRVSVAEKSSLSIYVLKQRWQFILNDSLVPRSVTISIHMFSLNKFILSSVQEGHSLQTNNFADHVTSRRMSREANKENKLNIEFRKPVAKATVLRLWKRRKNKADTYKALLEGVGATTYYGGRRTLSYATTPQKMTGHVIVFLRSWLFKPFLPTSEVTQQWVLLEQLEGMPKSGLENAG